MTSYIKNTGKVWTADDDAILHKLASENTSTRKIGLKLGRTQGAVRTRASMLGVPLRRPARVVEIESNAREGAEIARRKE